MTECIISSSVLIAVITALRFIFRGRISRRLQYALWGLVLLRLALPFSLAGSPISVMNLVDFHRAPETAYIEIEPDPGAGLPATPDIVTNSGSVQTPPDTVESRPMLKTGDVLRYVWIAGSGLTAAWFLGSNLVFYRRLRKTRRPYDAPAGRLRAYIAGGLASPCLFGVLRPAIYLTEKAAGGEKSVGHVIAHETCHYRHGDHVWSILRGLVLAAWWWNPLVWLAAFLSRADGELACDEAVIKRLPAADRLSYGYTLVDMIAVKPASLGLMQAATTMVSSGRGVKTRLHMIVKNPRAYLPAAAAALLLAAICAGCTFTGASTDEADSGTLGAVDIVAYEDNKPVWGIYDADGQALELAGEIIDGYDAASAAGEAPDLALLHLDYTLQVRDTEEKTAAFYYIFKKDGKPMLQKGQDGKFSALDQDLYDRLDALKNSSTENDLLDASDANRRKNEALVYEAFGISADGFDYIDPILGGDIIGILTQLPSGALNMQPGDGTPGAFINDTQLLVVVSRAGGESEVFGFRRADAGGQWELCRDPESFSVSAPPAGSYIYPVENGRITSTFGTRYHPITKDYKFHDGIDIAADEGTPVYAAAGGTVETAAYDAAYGNYVVIDHGGGVKTVYRHLRDSAVKKGDAVKAGDKVGTAGATGEAAGPHLHFSIKQNGEYIDPLPLFETIPEIGRSADTP